MSSLTLTPDTETEIVVKNKTKKSATKSRPALSYEEALKAIRAYDTCLKEAGKHRMFEPPTPTNEMISYHMAKGMICTGVLAAAEIVLSVSGVIPSGTGGFFITMGTVTGGLLGTIGTAAAEKSQRLFSPLKMKKIQQQYELNQSLVRLKEAEFAQLEADILKKAKKPVKVIQQHLQTENRTLAYSGEMGTEGFSIEEKTPMDAWEQELFKVKASKTRELESSQRKELIS